MKNLLNKINFSVNSNLYIKDPTSSELGRNILDKGTKLIDEIGYEQFTFKKLANFIETTEASIYRYFDSKHNFMLYLVNWYWSLVEYRLMMSILNIDDSKEKLRRAIKVVTSIPNEQDMLVFPEEILLKRIVVNESSKIYFTKNVDIENSLGAFNVYKSIVLHIGEIIKEVNPDYPFANMFVSTIMEAANQHRFFAEHLPRLTSKVNEGDVVESFALDLIERISGK